LGATEWSGDKQKIVKSLAFNASVKVKSKILPRYSDRKEKARMPELETNEKKENLDKTSDKPAEPLEGKECPKCGKLTIVRTTPNAGWKRFQCLSCGWKKDIYPGF
jgi:predicted RNA-binding Zn-ribbon protein involved in translation (DUF1610 family)